MTRDLTRPVQNCWPDDRWSHCHENSNIFSLFSMWLGRWNLPTLSEKRSCHNHGRYSILGSHFLRSDELRCIQPHTQRDSRNLAVISGMRIGPILLWPQRSWLIPTHPEGKVKIRWSVTTESGCNFAFNYFQFILNYPATRHPSSASTLLVGQEEGHPACKVCFTSSKGSVFEVPV